MSITLDGTNGITTPDLESSGPVTGTTGTFSGSVVSSNLSGRNRIINGAMMIDQRNAGASVTVNTYDKFSVDRFNLETGGGSVFTAQQSSVAPDNFDKSLLCTVTTTSTFPVSSDLAQLAHYIEGLNVADLGWGTASAKTITLSFWVRSSVATTYSIGFQNYNVSRSYVGTFTINSANTWEFKTITVPGDTTGTWLKTNGRGIGFRWCFGTGSSRIASSANTWEAGNKIAISSTSNPIMNVSGATFYITGVQLEEGSVATPFEHRQYGQELQLCQRYFQTWGGTIGNEYAPWFGLGYNSTTAEGCFEFIVPMRTAPSLTQVGNWVFNDVASDNAAGTLGIGTTGLQTTQMRSATATGITQYRPYTLRASNTTSRIQLSAEL